MPPAGSAWTGPSLTCTADGLDHLVSADAAAQGIAARQGTYTAMCGHLVQCLAIDFTVSYAVRYESSSGAVGDIRWATRSPGNFG